MDDLVTIGGSTSEKVAKKQIRNLRLSKATKGVRFGLKKSKGGFFNVIKRKK